MATSYLERRAEIARYFDRTAADAWKRLTSDAPLGRIRSTVRAGRDRMRETLASWLPEDLTGRRILDAGCGTGALSVLLARRGADVCAIDLSPTLVDLARERYPRVPGRGSVEWRTGDMLDAELGHFDHVVCMDSLIHYRPADFARALGTLAARCEYSAVVTFAPRTPALAVMHAVGRLFPRSDRAPAIEPISVARMRRLVAREPLLADWTVGRDQRTTSGFYMSHAVEIVQR